MEVPKDPKEILALPHCVGSLFDGRAHCVWKRIRFCSFHLYVVLIKSLTKNSLGVLSGLIIVFLLMEGFLRVYSPFGFRVKGDKIILPRNQVYTINNVTIRNLDSTVIHTKNSLGFRGPELPTPPESLESSLSIVVTGGSTTEAFYLSDGKDWPNLLRKKLEGNFDNLWLNNAGFDGFSTFGQRILLEDTLAEIKPKVVLFLMGINDVGAKNLNDAERFGTGEIPWTSLNNIVLSLSQKSEVVSLVVNIVRSYRAKDLGVGHEEISLEQMPVFDAHLDEENILAQHQRDDVPGYRQRIEALAARTKELGMEPVFITQPALYGDAVDPITGVDLGQITVGEWNGAVSWDVLELYNDAMREVAEENSILLIDLARLMEKNSLYFYDFIHYTNPGSEAIAQIVHEKLSPFLKTRYPAFVKDQQPALP